MAQSGRSTRDCSICNMNAILNKGIGQLLFLFSIYIYKGEHCKKQGRIHGYPSRVRVVRGSDREGHRAIWVGAVSSKTPKK